MTTQDVANRLVELCRKGQIMDAQKELYGTDIVSIEPENAPAPVKFAKGIEAVTEKGVQFASMIEERHGGNISDPTVAGNFFSLGWTLDATMKGIGRTKLEEICLYEVKDGKIVTEQFFY